jgi:hypothetical protein
VPFSANLAEKGEKVMNLYPSPSCFSCLKKEIKIEPKSENQSDRINRVDRMFGMQRKRVDEG